MEGDAFGSYILDRLLGRGTFGEVWRTTNQLAVKFVSMTLADRMDSQQEIENQRAACSHSNVLTILETVPDGPYTAIVTPLLRRDGASYMPVTHSMGQIACQIFSALAHCHEQGVVHGDVKPDNLLFDETGKNCYLSDFGASFKKDEPPREHGHTLAYSALESAIVWGRYSPASDTWAGAITVWELCTGERLIETESAIWRAVIRKLAKAETSPDTISVQSESDMSDTNSSVSTSQSSDTDHTGEEDEDQQSSEDSDFEEDEEEEDEKDAYIREVQRYLVQVSHLFGKIPKATGRRWRHTSFFKSNGSICVDADILELSEVTKKTIDDMSESLIDDDTQAGALSEFMRKICVYDRSSRPSAKDCEGLAKSILGKMT